MMVMKTVSLNSKQKPCILATGLSSALDLCLLVTSFDLKNLHGCHYTKSSVNTWEEKGVDGQATNRQVYISNARRDEVRVYTGGGNVRLPWM